MVRYPGFSANLAMLFQDEAVWDVLGAFFWGCFPVDCEVFKQNFWILLRAFFFSC